MELLACFSFSGKCDSSQNHPKKIDFFHLYRRKRDINDPLGQIHSLTSNKHCFRLKFVLSLLILKSGGTDGQQVRKLITTGRDCGSAEWIKNG